MGDVSLMYEVDGKLYVSPNNRGKNALVRGDACVGEEEGVTCLLKRPAMLVCVAL